MPATPYEEHLSRLYRSLNHRRYVSPDPLQFLYDYDDPTDREVVALTASCLAYGAVRQILKSVSLALSRMDSPAQFLANSSRESLERAFRDFKHRFTTGRELATMLYGVKCVLERHGSLNACFCSALAEDQDTVIPALTHLVEELSSVFDHRPRSLLPSPIRGSACKRLNLFLRWMVRRDDVDPGGWDNVPPSKLIVPLDVHMHRISLRLGFTARKQANLRAAIEVTDAFRSIAPDDPVRFDFSLTRLGIRDDTDMEEFVRRCKGDRS